MGAKAVESTKTRGDRSERPPLDFNIAAYNVFLRPRYFFADGQVLRSERLPTYLCTPSYDAIALCELFDRRCREALLAQIAPTYPYRTRLLAHDNPDWKFHGGVMVLSRWPIEDEAERLFGSAAQGDDILVDKGVVYARINKQGRAVHVFATHANARPWARRAQREQFAIIAEFITSRRIDPSEPVIIAGDLNVHRGRPDEVESTLSLLGAEQPPCCGHGHTYDPKANALATGRTQLYLDYVLYSRRHRQPLRCHNEVLKLRCSVWRQFFWQRGCCDLSDHYPVVGRFTF